MIKFLSSTQWRLYEHPQESLLKTHQFNMTTSMGQDLLVDKIKKT